MRIDHVSCGTSSVMAVVGLKNKPTLCYSLFNPPTIKCGTLESIVGFIFDNMGKSKFQSFYYLFYFIFILFLFYFIFMILFLNYFLIIFIFS